MISKIIEQFTPISKTSIDAIVKIVDYYSVKKGALFIEKTKSNNKEYFIIEGICRSFLLNPDGEEITISFFSSNSILSPYTTRTINGKSNLNFQALTDLTIGEMNASDFENLMVENLEIREFGNSVLRNELKLKIDKEISLASTTASERLQKFRKQFPLFENLIPHPTIASYLGITNISLSRLRRDLMK